MDHPDVLIMRHGETAWNRAGIMQGRLDSPLTEKGTAQAEELNKLLRNMDLPNGCTAWCSPQGRALQTAQIAFDGVFDDWVVDDRLCEIDIGKAQGMTVEDVFAAFPELDQHKGYMGWQFHCEGGEAYEDIQSRARSWLEDLRAPAVVVSHGIFSRVLRGYMAGLGCDQLEELPGGQGVIHRVRAGKQDILRGN